VFRLLEFVDHRDRVVLNRNSAVALRIGQELVSSSRK
jgi:hypothetical protein